MKKFLVDNGEVVEFPDEMSYDDIHKKLEKYKVDNQLIEGTEEEIVEKIMEIYLWDDVCVCDILDYVILPRCTIDETVEIYSKVKQRCDGEKVVLQDIEEGTISERWTNGGSSD